MDNTQRQILKNQYYIMLALTQLEEMKIKERQRLNLFLQADATASILGVDETKYLEIEQLRKYDESRGE